MSQIIRLNSHAGVIQYRRTKQKGGHSTVKLAKRSNHLPGIGISFHVSGTISESFPVERSTKITLHHENDPKNSAIIIKDVSRKADGTFIGTVFGFEPPAMMFGDLAINDTVSFTEDEIFGAIKED